MVWDSIRDPRSWDPGSRVGRRGKVGTNSLFTRSLKRIFVSSDPQVQSPSHPIPPPDVGEDPSLPLSRLVRELRVGTSSGFLFVEGRTAPTAQSLFGDCVPQTCPRVYFLLASSTLVCLKSIIFLSFLYTHTGPRAESFQLRFFSDGLKYNEKSFGHSTFY